ncbi:hypothetical protein ACS0TY_035842 [Phlomoides rotata]
MYAAALEGEMLVRPAKALFMDEITTGLDSSKAFQIVNFIRQFTHILKETVLMSLLQPEPEIYDLFDDVMLISEGHVVYRGLVIMFLSFLEQWDSNALKEKGWLISSKK